jgi:hypothetical protein
MGSPLQREKGRSFYVAQKALVTVFSIWRSKSSSCRRWHQDTLHYLQGEQFVRLVIVRRQSSGEVDRLSPSFFDLFVPAFTPRIHCSEAALRFAESTTFMSLCRVNTGIVSEQSRMCFRFRGDIIYLYIQYTILWQGRNLEACLPLFFSE